MTEKGPAEKLVEDMGPAVRLLSVVIDNIKDSRALTIALTVASSAAALRMSDGDYETWCQLVIDSIKETT